MTTWTKDDAFSVIDRAAQGRVSDTALQLLAEYIEEQDDKFKQVLDALGDLQFACRLMQTGEIPEYSERWSKSVTSAFTVWWKATNAN